MLLSAPAQGKDSSPIHGSSTRRGRHRCGHDGQRKRVAHMPTATTTTEDSRSKLVQNHPLVCLKSDLRRSSKFNREDKMDRRALLTVLAATALAGSLGAGAAYAQDTVKIGVIGPKTGFMAAGAAVTHWPNF